MHLNYGLNQELINTLQTRSNLLSRRRLYLRIKMLANIFLKTSCKRKKFKRWKRIGISKTDMKQGRNSFKDMRKISNWKREQVLRRVMLKLSQLIKTWKGPNSQTWWWIISTKVMKLYSLSIIQTSKCQIKNQKQQMLRD